MASKTWILMPSISLGGEGGKRERSSLISSGVGLTVCWRTLPLKAERQSWWEGLRGEGVVSCPSGPLIRSMSGLGSISDLRALRSCALSPNVVVLWSDDREEDIVVGGRRRGDVSSMIWKGDGGGASWAVGGEDELLPERSGNLTPDADRSITMAGGGGTYSGGVELSVSDVGLDPVEFIATAIDSGGVRVAIDIFKEVESRIVLHWRELSSCRVLILLFLS